MIFILKRYLVLLSLVAFSGCGPAFLQGTSTSLSKDDSKRDEKKVFEIKFEKLGIVGHFSWLKGPYPTTKESSFFLIFKDEKGNLTQLEDPYEFRVFIVMPSMGHGPADPGTFAPLAPHLYVNKELYFNMKGDWKIYFDVCLKSEKRCEGNNLIDSSSYSFLIK